MLVTTVITFKTNSVTNIVEMYADLETNTVTKSTKSVFATMHYTDVCTLGVKVHHPLVLFLGPPSLTHLQPHRPCYLVQFLGQLLGQLLAPPLPLPCHYRGGPQHSASH